MKKRRKSPWGIYAFAITWIALSLIFPLYRLPSLLITTGISLVVGAVVGAIVEKNRKKNEPVYEYVPENEPEPVSQYGPAVDAILADSKRAIGEMGRLYASIKDPEIRKKINELMRVTDKIAQDAIEDPSDVPQIKKFMNYYLPTTIKLLNSYDRMGSQGIEGDNLNKSMKNIEEMLDTAIDAFKKQLDSLFENQAMDIETDIDVMNKMLAREGLSGSKDFDVASHVKSQEEKASQTVPAAPYVDTTKTQVGSVSLTLDPNKTQQEQ